MALATITRPRSANQGGGLKVYFAEVSTVDTIAAATAKVISTDVTMNASAVFNEIEFTENTCQFTDTMLNENGDNNAWRKNVLMDVAKLRAEINAILESAVGQRFIVFVKDANDQVWLVGSKERPARLSAAAADTGATAEDSNKYALAFIAEDIKSCDEYTGEIPLT